MPHHRVGNQRRVLLSDLLDYLQRRDGDRWVKRAKMEAWFDLIKKVRRASVDLDGERRIVLDGFDSGAMS